MHCNGKLIKIKQTCSKNAGSVILHKCFVVINWWFLYCIWRFLWLILAIWARWFLNQWRPGNVGAVQILHILSLSSAKPSDFILQSFNLKIVKKIRYFNFGIKKCEEYSVTSLLKLELAELTYSYSIIISLPINHFVEMTGWIWHELCYLRVIQKNI